MGMQRRALEIAFSAVAIAGVLAFARTASAASYEVGPTQTHKSVCLLLADKSVTLGPADVVTVDAGTYTDVCQVHPSGTATQPITLQGAAGPRPVFDAKGADVSGSGSVPRAILQFTGGSYWVVEHLELENASNSSNNGAAFRLTAGSHDVTLRDVSIHDNQDGAMSDGPATVVIENSEIFHNGAGDGQSHNLYMTGDAIRLQGNYIHDSVGGQNVKLRVHTIELLYNLIANEGNYAIDFEQAGNTTSANANAIMIGNVVVRNPNAVNHGQTIVFGDDNPGAGVARNGNLYAINNTFVLTQANTGFLHMLNPAPGSQAFFYNNVFHATASGAKLAFDNATNALMSGSNNWVTTGIAPATAFTASQTGADPGFVSATDFHLQASAPAIDQGMSSPQFVDGTGATADGTPTLEYVAPLGVGGRPSDGKLDLGAYEYGTPTPVPDGGVDASTSGDGGSMTADGGTVEGDGGTTTTDTGGCSCTVATRGDAPRGLTFSAIALGAAFALRRRRRAELGRIARAIEIGETSGVCKVLLGRRRAAPRGRPSERRSRTIVAP